MTGEHRTKHDRSAAFVLTSSNGIKQRTSGLSMSVMNLEVNLALMCLRPNNVAVAELSEINIMSFTPQQ
jgi:hypothetical protein